MDVPKPRPASHAPDGSLRLGNGCTIAPGALDFSFVRGSGPGGQHVNKTSTKAQLRVLLAELRGLDVAGIARLRFIAGSHLVGEGADEAILISDHSSRSQADRRVHRSPQDTCLDGCKATKSSAKDETHARKR